MRTTIDSAGRIVVPKALREELGLVGGMAVEVRTRDGQLEIEPMSNEIRLEKRGRGLVAVSDTPVPPLDAEGVRSVVERLRR